VAVPQGVNRSFSGPPIRVPGRIRIFEPGPRFEARRANPPTLSREAADLSVRVRFSKLFQELTS
jgi:hypothetical protein